MRATLPSAIEYCYNVMTHFSIWIIAKITLVCSIVSNCVMKVLILDEFRSSVSLISVKEVEIQINLGVIWSLLDTHLCIVLSRDSWPSFHWIPELLAKLILKTTNFNYGTRAENTNTAIKEHTPTHARTQIHVLKEHTCKEWWEILTMISNEQFGNSRGKILNPCLSSCSIDFLICLYWLGTYFNFRTITSKKCYSKERELNSNQSFLGQSFKSKWKNKLQASCSPQWREGRGKPPGVRRKWYYVFSDWLTRVCQVRIHSCIVQY